MKYSTLFFLFLFYSMHLTAQTTEITQLKEILSKKETSPDNIILATIQSLFEEYYFREDTIESLHYADLLVRESKKRNNLFYEKQGRLNQAYLLLKKEKEKAKSIVDTIINVVDEVKEKQLIAQCYTFLGHYQLTLNQRDTSSFYFQKAFSTLGNSINKESIEALIGLSKIAFNKKKLDKASNLIMTAYKQAEQIQSNILIIKTLSKAGYLYYIRNKYEQSSNLIIKAIQLADEYNYITPYLLKNYSILADLYWVKNDDIYQARHYTQKAYELNKEFDSPLIKVETASDFAYYHLVGKGGNKELAEELIQYSLELSNKHNFEYRQAVAHFYLGMLYSLKDLFKKAYPHFIKSIQIAEEINYKNYSLRVQSYLAEEIENRNEDLPINTDINEYNLNALDSKVWFYKIKKNIAVKNKQYQKAHQAWEQLSNLMVEAQREACKISVEEQLLACKLEEQEEKLAVKEALIQSTTFKNRLLGIASALTTLLVGLFYFMYRTKRQHNQEIIEKNEKISEDFKEISTLNNSLNLKNKLLAQKNEFHKKEIVDYIALQNNRDRQLNHLKEEIKKEIETKSEHIEGWQIIKNRIEKLISDKDSWLHFKRKIESLHPNFFMNLLLQHPKLTEREQRHCAYIMLGMSVNQVAKSLFITSKSAESARYRLKKKMNLDKTDSLGEYIRNIGN